MKREPLWYIRREGVVSGPFPVRLIERYTVLGRVNAATELSVDNVHWAFFAELPEWVAYIEGFKSQNDSEEHMEALRRWEDERGGYDRRRGTPTNIASDQRNSGDRRDDEEYEQIEKRQQRSQRKPNARMYSLKVVAIPIFAVMMFIGFYLVLYKPPAIQDPIDCSIGAAEGVNWSYCNLQNIDLQNVSLRHSDLKSSNLTGARFIAVDVSASDLSFSLLTRTRISDSSFSSSRMIGVSFRNSLINNVKFIDSDLTYADFSNAEFINVDFSGARLDHAIWIDRRRCAANSIGICR
ncbi:MAG: pentapeptide repeat-containing protein [Thiotrichales bacterium]|nr:pentapeptide repeat-containing protein [Thiotrichales bacterium]